MLLLLLCVPRALSLTVDCSRHSKIPSLVAWATNDHLLEPHLPRQLQEALGPDSVALEVHSGGHFINKSHAYELADAILARSA